MVRRMAAATAVALVAAGLSHPPCAAASKPKPPPPRYTFAGIPWLVSADTARARLEERGYRPVSVATDRNQLVGRGKLFDHDAIVTGHLDDQGRLVRWVVLVVARDEPYKWPDMRAVFDEVVREGEGRYGTPRNVEEKYRFPYRRGDGRQDEALRDGLATIRRTWASKSGDRLMVEMDANVSVVLTYECQEWGALEARRRAKRASDL